VFLGDKAILEYDIRLIGIKEIKELIPESAMALCLQDVEDQVNDIVIKEYSAYDWDECMDVIRGNKNLYSLDEHTTNICRRYFTKGTLDVAHINIGKKDNLLFGGMNELVKGNNKIIYISNEYHYKEMKDCVKGIHNIIPFQFIAINGTMILLCCDHGVPVLIETDLVEMKECAKYELIQNRMKLVNMLPRLIHNASMENKSFNSELAGLYNKYSVVDCDNKQSKPKCNKKCSQSSSSDECEAINPHTISKKDTSSMGKSGCSTSCKSNGRYGIK